MNKVSFTCCIFVIFSLILLSKPLWALDQDQDIAQPQEKPGQVILEEDLIEIQNREVSVRNKDLLDGLKPYLAVAEDELLICYSTKEPEDCVKDAESIYLIKNIAEGNIDSIDDVNMQKLSAALLYEGDEKLTDYPLNLYKGIKECDPTLVSKGMNSAEFIKKHGKFDKDSPVILINLYYGFLTNSADPKIAFDEKDTDIEDILGYKLLFNPEGPTVTLDSIAHDFAVLAYVKEYKKTDKPIIDLIKDPYIKRLATDPNIKNLDDIFKK
ncbi:MAG: hypothetical protein D4S01_04005 [Dehalococcoidia bacterium]|nr:MAG: hypothetical protein D4S01_04005 [Dehalococcoidia bacterium]